MISLLSFISSLWTTSRANGSLPANGGAHTCLGLHHLHTQEMGDRTASVMGQAGRPRLISTRFSRPFAPVGPFDILHFAPFNCIILAMSSSRPR
jgi:hypothetical protein